LRELRRLELFETGGEELAVAAAYRELSYHARRPLHRMRRRPTLVCAIWEQAELFPL
jgi:hypothetical protein